MGKGEEGGRRGTWEMTAHFYDSDFWEEGECVAGPTFLD